jgi:osmotically-inducible protein OsmY
MVALLAVGILAGCSQTATKSPDVSARAEKVATGVPNVTQVVNNLQVKNQKASSSQ